MSATTLYLDCEQPWKIPALTTETVRGTERAELWDALAQDRTTLEEASPREKPAQELCSPGFHARFGAGREPGEACRQIAPNLAISFARVRKAV